MNRQRNRHGFTIVELVIVIAVIAILATTLVPTFGNVIQSAQDAAAKQEAKNAYTSYMIDHPEQAGSLFVYETDGRFVVIQNGAPMDIFDTQEEAMAALPEANAIRYRLTPAGNGLYLCTEGVSYAGKKISILGDSISTYSGVSNNANYNSTIGNNEIYYPNALCNDQSSTWWQQVIDALGMELCVNNSWSGSTVFPPRKGAASVGYGDRAVNLHNDHTGEEPDVIAIFMGTNDFSYYQSSLGTADIDYSFLISANNDGSYSYAEPKTTCQAYAIMLHKITVRYPEAEIYCMSLLPRRAEDYSGDSVKDPGVQPTAFNGELAKIAQHFGCTVVDWEHCGITPEPDVFDLYITDKRVHPGELGMDLMTNALLSEMLGMDVSCRTVSTNYAGVVSNNPASTAIYGDPYRAELSLREGYDNLSVKVTMGGRDITAECYRNGVIYIPFVNSDVTIQAQATKSPLSYRWEFAGSAVTNVTTNSNAANKLEKLGGNMTDGILQGAYFHMAEDVILRHDLPWAVEWSAAGNWSGMILSQKQTASTEGNIYLFKSNSSAAGLVAFGHRANNQYENYGIEPGKHDLVPSDRHIYRVENRINPDGTNTIHLLVDHKDLGPMDEHFHGASAQNETLNWAGGQDFLFSYIGANGHAMTDCDLDYLQIWENTQP